MNLISRGEVWSLALFVADRPFDPDWEFDQPIKLFNSARPRLLHAMPDTQADPFLLTDNDFLYVFFERKYLGGVGKIACMRSRDLNSFEDFGIVLSEPHHLSFPFAFRHGSATYLAPESSKAGELNLYRFNKLPDEIIKARRLIEGTYVDPFLLQQKDKWYLFATSEDGLEVFVADDLLTGTFHRHPKSPIASDARYSRSAGGPITIGNQLVRVAQDCSRRYGENVSLIEICCLTPDDYSERLTKQHLFKLNYSWNTKGTHHLSVAEFKGATVVAVDGRHPDFWPNKFLRRLPHRR